MTTNKKKYDKKFAKKIIKWKHLNLAYDLKHNTKSFSWQFQLNAIKFRLISIAKTKIT